MLDEACHTKQLKIRDHNWRILMIYMWFTGINDYKLAVAKDRDSIFTTIRKPGFKSFPLYRIAFHSGAKKHLPDTYCTTFRSWEKQHLSVATIPLKIAFLKGTDRCFFTSLGKLSGTECKRSLTLPTFSFFIHYVLWRKCRQRRIRPCSQFLCNRMNNGG
jgi:hypothetical protein